MATPEEILAKMNKGLAELGQLPTLPTLTSQASGGVSEAARETAGVTPTNAPLSTLDKMNKGLTELGLSKNTVEAPPAPGTSEPAPAPPVTSQATSVLEKMNKGLSELGMGAPAAAPGQEAPKPGETAAPGQPYDWGNAISKRFHDAWNAPEEGPVGHTWGVINTPIIAGEDIAAWTEGLTGGKIESLGPVFGGITKGVLELAGGMSSPLSLGFILGTMGAGALVEGGALATLKAGQMTAAEIGTVMKGAKILSAAVKAEKTSKEAIGLMELAGIDSSVVSKGLDLLSKAGLTSGDLVAGGLVRTAGSAGLRSLGMTTLKAERTAQTVQGLIEAGFAGQNVYGAAMAIPEAMDAIKDGDTETAARLITAGAGMTGFGLLGTKAVLKEAGHLMDDAQVNLGLKVAPSDTNVHLKREIGVADRQVTEAFRTHELWAQDIRKMYKSALEGGEEWDSLVRNYVDAGGDEAVMQRNYDLILASAGRAPVNPAAPFAVQPEIKERKTVQTQPKVLPAPSVRVPLYESSKYEGGSVSEVFDGYHAASEVPSDRNPYVRLSEDPVRSAKETKNENRTLLVQISSNLMNDLAKTADQRMREAGLATETRPAYSPEWTQLLERQKEELFATLPAGKETLAEHKARLEKETEIRARHQKEIADFTSKAATAPELTPEQQSTEYYEKLYDRTRPGYTKPRDFWEIPDWAARTSHFLPDSDFYVVRNVEEAKKFFNEAKYGSVVFSVMDVNKDIIKSMLFSQENPKGYAGRVDMGGYVDPKFFEAHPNANWHGSPASMAEALGVPYKEGVSYRHFQGSDTIPRLTLSEGCLHKCAFCVIANSAIKMTPDEVVNQQVGEISKLGAKLVYVNDKTFGQAKNYQQLSDLYARIKKENPSFLGFAVQTTAAQMNKIPEAWLAKSGIRYVELGIESYNDPLLREMHKPATEQLINKAVDKLRKNKIALIPNILIGYPGETAETYARTMDFLRHNKDIISHANIYNIALYEDTELGKKMTTASEADFNENILEKSFHKDPHIVRQFAGDLYGFAAEQLGQIPEVLQDLRPLNEMTAREAQQLAIGKRADVFYSVLKRLPAVQELVAAAKAGSKGKDWYERSIKAFDAVRELAPNYFKADDVDIFAGVVAATSPQQSVVMNLREALTFWKEWKDNGMPKTREEIEALQRAKRGKAAPITRLTNQGSKLPNILRAINREEWFPETKEKYFKVGSFARNLQNIFKDPSGTFDVWMGAFFGLDETKVAQAPFYHAMAVQTRLAAQELGWSPKQAQAAIWSFTKTLAEASGWKTAQGKYFRPEEVVDYLTPEDYYANAKDMASLINEDTEVRFKLHQMGVNLNELSKRLEALPEPEAVAGAIEEASAPLLRRAGERIGEAQRRLEGFKGEYADFAAESAGTASFDFGDTSFDFGANLDKEVAHHGTPNIWESEEGFPLGRPKTEMIGSGEGNQTYGWGLYFAQSPGVAKHYRPQASRTLQIAGTDVKSLLAQVKPQEAFLTLSELPGVPGGARRFRYDPRPEVRVMNDLLVYSFGNKNSAEILSSLRKEYEFSIKKRDAALKPIWEENIKVLDKIEEEGFTTDKGPAGATYTVDIPDEHVAKMLQWDEFISEQSPEVKAAVGYKEPEIRKTPEGVYEFRIHSSRWQSIDWAKNAEEATKFAERWAGKGDAAYRGLIAETFTPEGRAELMKEIGVTPGPEDMQTPIGRIGMSAPELVSRVLDKRGVPGIKYLDQLSRIPGDDTKTSNFVVFNPKDVKVLSRDAGGVVEHAPVEEPGLSIDLQKELRIPGFYSPMERAVNTLPDRIGSRTVEKWLTRRGVSKMELEESGLPEWLAFSKRTLSKSDIVQFLKDHEISVEETLLGAPAETLSPLDAEMLKRYQKWERGKGTYGFSFKLSDAEEKHFASLRNRLNPMPASYSSHVKPFEQGAVPGSYRELVIRSSKPDVEPYKGGHYENHKGAIGWLRFDERITPEGKRVMFLHEAQEGDAFKAIKKRGTVEELQKKIDQMKPRVEETLAALNAAVEKFVPGSEGVDDALRAIYEKERRATPEYNTLVKLKEDTRIAQSEVMALEGALESYPQVPYVNNWLHILLKRALRYAAENNFDAVAWTSGEHQNTRWSLRKVLDHIAYDPSQKMLVGYKGRERVFRRGQVEPGELGDYIGQDMARKLLAAEPTMMDGLPQHQLKGKAMEVGGEGMKGFYGSQEKDSPGMIGNFFMGYGKKWNAKVGNIKIPASLKYKVSQRRPVVTNERVHAVSVTGSMKQDVMNFGQNIAKEVREAKPLTKTPEFEKWYGGSQLRVQGEPVVMYHGTLADFTEFSKRKGMKDGDWGAGLYFTNNPEDASLNYARIEGPDVGNKLGRLVDDIQSRDESISLEQARELAKKQMGVAHGGAVLPTYLALKNPFELGGRQATAWDAKDIKKFFTGIRQAAKKMGITLHEETLNRLYGSAWEMEGSPAAVILDRIWQDPSMFAAEDKHGNYTGKEMARRALEYMGYDGVLDRTVTQKFGLKGMDKDTYHAVVFKPEQVKSATGNIGTFDPSNPDIRAQLEWASVPGKGKDVPVVTEAMREHPLARFHGTESPEELAKLGPFVDDKLNRLGEQKGRIDGTDGKQTVGYFKNERGENTLVLAGEGYERMNRALKGALEDLSGGSAKPSVTDSMVNFLQKHPNPLVKEIGAMLEPVRNEPLSFVMLTSHNPFATLIHEHAHGLFTPEEASRIHEAVKDLPGYDDALTEISGIISESGTRVYDEPKIFDELIPRLLAGQLRGKNISHADLANLTWEILNAAGDDKAYSKILGNVHPDVRSDFDAYLFPERPAAERQGVLESASGRAAGERAAQPSLIEGRAEQGPGGVRAGAEQLPSEVKSTIHEALNDIDITKGFTVNPRTGLVPQKTGFAVEVIPERRKVLDHKVTIKDIEDFAKHHDVLLQERPELFVGGYENELNISAVLTDRATAVRMAELLDQKAVWDFAAGDEIKTKGTGKQTKTLGLTLDDRLKIVRDRSIGTEKYELQRQTGAPRGTDEARLWEMARKNHIRDTHSQKEIDSLLRSYDPKRLTDQHRALGREITRKFNENFQRAHAGGALDEGLENYVTHMWQKDVNNPAAQRLMAEAKSGRFAVNTSMAKHRVFSHAIEGQLLGRKLAVTDPIALAAHNGNVFDRVLAYRSVLDRLRDKGLQASDGRPLVALSGTGKLVQGPDGENEAVVVHPDRVRSIRISDKVVQGLRNSGDLDRLVKQGAIVKYGEKAGKVEGQPGVEHYAWATHDYRSVDHPSFEGWQYASQDTNGAPILVRGDLKVHPEGYEYLKRQLDQNSPLAQNPVMKHVFTAGREAKGILLSFDIFHLIQEGLRAIMTGISPFGVEKWDLRTNPTLGKLVEHGLTMKDGNSITSFQEGMAAGHSHLMDKIPAIGPASAWFQDFLFSKYLPGLKARAGEHLYERYKKLYPQYSDEHVLKLAAEDTNMRFGGLNLRREGRAVVTQDVFRLVALAPDWLESELRSIGRAMGGDGKVMRRDLAKVAVGLWLAARVLNQLNTGNAHYEAPFGVAYKDDEGRDKVISLRTLPTDMLHAVHDPLNFMRHRMSPLQRTVNTVYSGRDSQGRRLPTRDLVWDILGEALVPLPLQTVTKKMSGFKPTETWKEQGIKSMGAQVSEYKTEAQKKAAELAADRSESGPVDKDKLKQHAAKLEIEDRLRAGTIQVADIWQMVDQELLHPKEAKAIVKSAMETKDLNPQMARLYMRAARLPAPDFLLVWEHATNAEKEVLTKQMIKKKNAYFRKAFSEFTATERQDDPTYQKLKKMFPDQAPF